MKQAQPQKSRSRSDGTKDHAQDDTKWPPSESYACSHTNEKHHGKLTFLSLSFILILIHATSFRSNTAPSCRHSLINDLRCGARLLSSQCDEQRQLVWLALRSFP